MAVVVIVVLILPSKILMINLDFEIESFRSRFVDFVAMDSQSDSRWESSTVAEPESGEWTKPK